MPRAHSASSVQVKKYSKKSPKTATKVATPKKAEHISSQSDNAELSYETQLIITILLLLFVYPVGLIFMWWWMKQWPLWLKILITIPLIFGVFVFFAAILIIGTILSHVKVDTNTQQELQKQLQQQEMRLSGTPLPSLPVSMTPTTNTSGTY